MSFSDYRFIYVFMPLAILLYRFTPNSLRKPLLIVTGVFFFCFGNNFLMPDCLILPAVILLTWLCSYMMSVLPEHRKMLAFTFIAIPIAGLLYYKYRLGRLPFGSSVILLLSVSFISDLYRSKKQCRDLISIGAYLSFFPVMPCGPLTKYGRFYSDLKKNDVTLENIADGVRRFIIGLSMKVLLADTLAGVWDAAVGVGISNASTLLLWFAAISFTMRIYFELYGFSLMASGVALALGVRLPDNFRSPFLCHSFTGFWGKWEITVVGWFKEHVYAHLGGAKKNRASIILSIFVTCLAISLWLGFSSNYITFMVLIFLLLSIEQLGAGRFLDRHRFIAALYMLFFLPITFAVFASGSVSESISFVSGMLSINHGEDFLPIFRAYLIPFLAGLVFCTPLPADFFEKFRKAPHGTIVYALLLGLSLYMLVRTGGSSPLNFIF